MKGENNRGFINIIVIAILALAAAKYFLNWDIFDAASSAEGQSTIGYIRDIVNTVWSYIGEPIMWIFREVVWPLLSFAYESLRAMIETGRAAMNY